MTVPYDEHRALKLLSQGSKEGFTALYNRYAPGIVDTALMLLKSDEMAQDLIQEVFFQIWTERQRFSSVDNFEAYLFICVRNRARHLLKKRSREEAAKSQYFALKKLSENSVEDYIFEKELSEYLGKAIDDLPPQVKRVYHMLIDEKLSQKDVAERLNISQITVKDHLYRARVFIKERMQKHIAAAAYTALSCLILN